MAARKVLIVDDNSDSGADLGARLARLGYEVTGIAASGHEALGLVEETNVDAVLINAALGGDLDGLRTADEIRKQRMHLPILFTVDETDELTLRRVATTVPRSTHLLRPFADRELRIALTLATEPDESTLDGASDQFEDRFFDIAIDMLCCLRFNGHFARLNPSWERTLGYTREELMSRPFIEFVHPDDRERTLEQNRKVREGGQANMFENRYLCKDGSHRWFLWNATPDAGRHTIYSVARDITEWKRAEAEREELVTQLQKALAEVKSLQDILPTCAYCRKVRDEHEWRTMEDYVSRHTNSRFSHGICPTCFEEQLEKLEQEPLTDSRE